jgi:hypothetical protein
MLELTVQLPEFIDENSIEFKVSNYDELINIDIDTVLSRDSIEWEDLYNV